MLYTGKGPIIPNNVSYFLQANWHESIIGNVQFSKLIHKAIPHLCKSNSPVNMMDIQNVMFPEQQI
jgi:hypothetical protein